MLQISCNSCDESKFSKLTVSLQEMNQEKIDAIHSIKVESRMFFLVVVIWMSLFCAHAVLSTIHSTACVVFTLSITKCMSVSASTTTEKYDLQMWRSRKHGTSYGD